MVRQVGDACVSAQRGACQRRDRRAIYSLNAAAICHRARAGKVPDAARGGSIHALEPPSSQFRTTSYLIVIFSTVQVEQSPLISTLSETACIS